MLEIKNGKLVVNIHKINKSKFYVTEDKGFYFIHPHKNMWEWAEEEKKIRSIIVDSNGYVVSSGWPKFGNLNEPGFENDSSVAIKAIENNEVVRFTHKEDGSLCIRSVINGGVVLRTRGTMWGGTGTEEEDSFGDRFKEAAKKYPSILDPNWMNDRSLLFEYVSPSNTIVLRYAEEDLVFIGFMNHDLTIGKWEDVENIAKEGNLNLVRTYNLARDVVTLLDDIKTWREEGVVVRCNDDQTFVKIKSAYYLANHRMKYFMTYKNMLEFLLHLNITEPGHDQELEEALRECNYDWEVISCAKEFYKRFEDAYRYANKKLEQANELLDGWLNKHGCILWDSEQSRRKEFAKFACSQEKTLTSFLFKLYDSKLFNKDKFGINRLMNKIIVNEENLTRSKKNA